MVQAADTLGSICILGCCICRSRAPGGLKIQYRFRYANTNTNTNADTKYTYQDPILQVVWPPALLSVATRRRRGQRRLRSCCQPSCSPSHLQLGGQRGSELDLKFAKMESITKKTSCELVGPSEGLSRHQLMQRVKWVYYPELRSVGQACDV